MAERPQDELWNVLSELFGEPRTRPEQTRRGKCVKELRFADATADEVRIAHAYCKKNFTTFTEFAVVSHLAAALHEHKTADPTGFIEALERMMDQ